MALKYEYASEEDGEEIARLLENVDFEGEISIAYGRRPNAVRSLARDGEHSVFVKGTDSKTGQIVGVGGCVIKDGQAYLTGLRATRIGNIPKCYELIRSFCEEHNAKVTYTTILSDNIAVQKMLEKKRPSMPAYLRYGESVIHIIRKGLKIKDKNSLIEVGDMYQLKSQSGLILAQCQVVEQWDYKQYIVKHYGKKMKLAQRFFRWIPKENEVLKFFTLAKVESDSQPALESLLRHISHIDKEGSFFIYGGINAPCPVRSIKYTSIVYIVDWEKALSDVSGIELDFEIANL